MTDISPQSNLPPWRQKRQGRSTIPSGAQFDRFLGLEIDNCDIPDILHYWIEKGKNVNWSEIAAMAITIHCIPAMSADVERVSSR